MAESSARLSEIGSGLGRFIDYVFGRNSLIGLASMMLLMISGYATWSGMNDFIIGTAAPTGQTGQNIGGVQITSDLLVIAITIALTFLMWLALRETFGAQRRWTERLVTFPLYVFLALWSIGFGYGFWWSLIAGVDATRTSMASLQEDARDASAIVAARLDAVRAQLDNVVTWSDGQMAREESSGGSCGVPSGAGRGPLYQARRSVRDSVATLRDGMLTSWLGPVQADVEKLRTAATALTGATTAERQANFETMASDIRGRARNIAARSNELGKSTAAEMRALAESVSIAPGQPGFSCYDPTLAERLRQAAIQAGAPAELQLRDATFNEGATGVANAVKNLWNNIGAYAYGSAIYLFSGGHNTDAFTASGTPISGRDVIALLATIGIDLGLFALALLNPPAAGPVRRDGLAATQARLHLPPASVIRSLRSAFDTAIARAPGADLEWVRRHFIHHDGSSYFVIPNLYSVATEPKDEALRALAMNQLAGVFDDLKLVRALQPHELQRFGRDELRDSYSDLTPFRQQRAEIAREEAARDADAIDPAKPLLSYRLPWQRSERPHHGKGMRNHGLLSKASRALDIAGWSKQAQSDVEIFRLTDTEGLTPLLALLNEDRMIHEDTADAPHPNIHAPAQPIGHEPTAVALAAPPKQLTGPN